MFPIIELKGEPFARGMAYGRAAHHQIAGSVRCYAALFASCGIDWREAQKRALEFRELIAGCGGGIIEEIQGIAAGSGFREEEILALNCRTEILPPTFLGMPDNDSGAARERNSRMGLFDLGECTSVAVSGSRCADGHTRVAQNWDWLGYQRQNVVVLRVKRESWPDYVTLTEAGIIAKIGVNEHGVGAGLNILRATNDREVLGMPVHIFQRLALDSSDVASVIAMAKALRFGASSNTILGDPSGRVASLEYGPSGTAALKPDFGIVAHTNHFCDPDLKPWQAPLTQMLTSEPRLACADRHIVKWPDLIVDSHLMTLLRDETGDPSAGADAKFGAICRHPDPSAPPELRVESVFGVIIDCNARRMRVAAGLPSRVEFEVVGL
ncbi:MAG: hypothetical protein JNL19_02880 [Burkholderiales bacterium]|nr:hypothetical protein [Burkholderiales bacterium]